MKTWLFLIALGLTGCGRLATSASKVPEAPSPKADATAAVAPEPEPTDCTSLAALTQSAAVRVDHYLVRELCTDLYHDPAETLSALRAAKRTVLITRGAAARLGLSPPRVRRARDIYVLGESSAQQEAVLTELGVEPYLGAGGVLGLLHLQWNTDGHYEVTGKALEELQQQRDVQFVNLSDDARALMQDASQEPDYYAWGVPQAHAQRGNAAPGSGSSGTWQRRWSEWTTSHFAKAMHAAESGRHDEALFWIGYGLHAVQDLASHRGQTSAEHSYLALRGDGPDEDPEAIRHAVQLSKIVLRNLAEQLSSTWPALIRYRGERELPKEKKQALIGHGWNWTLEQLWEYRNQGARWVEDPSLVQLSQPWCEPGRCMELVRALGTTEQ